MRTALAAAGALLLILAPSAAAGTGSATVFIPDEGYGTATAVCPEGERATGGGFQFSDARFFVGPYESRKIGQRAWQVSATRRFTGGDQSTNLTAHVYCSKNAPKTKRKSSGASSLQARAECPPETTVQAGGFLGTPGFFPFDSLRVGRRTWFVRTSEEIATLQAFAYCAGEPPPRKMSTTETGPRDAVGPGGLFRTNVASPNCPRGTKPRAGGFSEPNFAQFVDVHAVHQSVAVGRAWLTSATSQRIIAPGQLSSIVYCN